MSSSHWCRCEWAERLDGSREQAAVRGPPSLGRRRSRDRVSAPNGPYDPVAAAESFGPPTSSFALPFIPEGALLRELMNPGKGRKRGVGGRTSACPGSLRRPRPRRWWETSPPRRSSCSAVSDHGGGGFQCVRLVLIDVSSHPSHPVPSCSRLHNLYCMSSSRKTTGRFCFVFSRSSGDGEVEDGDGGWWCGGFNVF